MIRIAQFGLGPIGVESVKLAATKGWAEVVGAVDIDPAKHRRDLGELSGLKSLAGRRVYARLDELLAQSRPDVVLHTSVSKFRDAFAQIEPMVRQGISVVSSCEELVFPQLREPKLTADLHALCQENAARVIGVGVNPGFVMDLLPICMTAVSCDVRAIHIQRVVNASTRRQPLQQKIGSGRAPAEFGPLLEKGDAGHAGLRESLALIAHALAWQIESVQESAEPVLADHAIHTRFFDVAQGQVCGIHQRVEAQSVRGQRLTLDIQMFLDAPSPHDTVQIDGEPRLHLRIDGGVAGDSATVASLLNTVPRLLNARPGLLLLTDLPLPRFA